MDTMLYRLAMMLFYIMALVVAWHQLAPSDYKVLTDTGMKLWAMAGLSLYCVILLERHRRKKE